MANAKPKKTGHKSHDKVTAQAAQSYNRGHNKSPELCDAMTEYLKLDEQKKQLSAAQRDIRATVKEKFGFNSNVFNHEVRLQKMDQAARKEFQEGHYDFQKALGIQMALDLTIAKDRREAEEASAEGEGEKADPVSIATAKAKKAKAEY